MFKFCLLLLTLGLVSASAQQLQPFSVYQAKSMSSDALVISIQQPTTGRVIWPVSATLECPSATRLSIELDCSTAATTTATTPIPKSHTRGASSISAFIDSDAASCTVLASFPVSANTPRVVNLYEEVFLPRSAPASGSYSLVMRSGTVTSGTCYGLLTWRE